MAPSSAFACATRSGSLLTLTVAAAAAAASPALLGAHHGSPAQPGHTGALFMGVVRARAAEGLDFAVLATAQQQLSLNFCAAGSPTQQFYYFAPNSTIVLASSGYCIDIEDYGTTPGSVAWTNPCHHDDKDPSHQNQAFTRPSTSASTAAPLIEIMSGLAMEAGSSVAPGSLITLNTASSASPLWLNVTSPSNGGTGPLIHAASGLCVEAGAGVTGATPLPVALMPCGNGVDDSARRQVFSVSGGALQLSTPRVDGSILCLSVSTYSSTSSVVTSPCPPPGTAVPAVQTFTAPSTGGGAGYITTALFNSTVLDWASPGQGKQGWAGIPARLSPQSASSSQWTWSSAGLPNGQGRLVHQQSGMCLDAGGVPNSHGCLDPSVHSLPFCDVTLPIESRVADLLSRLSLDEKIALTGAAPIADTCDTIDPGVPRLDIPPHEWLVETNSMVASACYGNTCATAFPSSANLAASFNRTLWNAKGQTVSTEMRVLNNLRWHRQDGQQGTIIGLSGFGPDINQPRDPRNGRAGELPSEDPLLLGEYAVQYVRGMQEAPLDPMNRLKMSAGVKHYAGYSMETNRFGSVGNFSTYDLWDTYLPAYEKAFVEGQAAGSMCAYISLGIDGGPYIPACANEYLLSTVVREYWGRPDATHTSDCGAVANMADANHYVTNYTYAAAAAVNAGMDLNSNTILPQNLATAVQLGLTTEAAIDAAVGRTLAVRMRLGLLDPLEDQPYTQVGPENLNTPQAKALIQEGVAQGIVLVKNAGGVLPLKPGIKLAVLGPLADAAHAIMGDYYADQVCPTGNMGATAATTATAAANSGAGRYRRGKLGLSHDYSCVTTVAAALTAANVGGSTVTYPGVQINANDTSWAQAISAASASDVIILALGTDLSIGEEGTDLTDIGMPGNQTAFGQAVLAAAAGKPVIMVLLSSFPTAYDELAASLSAIVLGYAPGFGAPAIASTLFGTTNRWGRATMTIYPHAYQNAVALDDFSMTPIPGRNPGRTYRYYDGTAGAPLVRFGQGLSYSSYSLACAGGYVSPGSDSISVDCNVTQVSGPAGELVLLVEHRASGDVIRRIGGQHPVPLSTLVGFDRWAVPAGAGQGSVPALPVTLQLAASSALTLVDETGAAVLYPGLHYLDVWDGSANNVTLAIEVPGGRGGEAVVVKRPPPMPAGV